ncbi:MAG TPA: phosphatidylglycerophosphatase A [Chitinophagaceae bacterium]|nr:phosphatidylglycerophosphatase A [Chitinophagaceae bacterium]
MIKLHKAIASVFGIGFLKGGGTVAAIACCLLSYWLPAGDVYYSRRVFIAGLVLLIGVWSAGEVEPWWGKDSSRVVIDEVAGMMVTLLFIPLYPRYVIAGLVLFRFFDIAKPFFIRRLEKLPKGWGVMADDLLAGIYAHLVLSMVIACKLF